MIDKQGAQANQTRQTLLDLNPSNKKLVRIL